MTGIRVIDNVGAVLSGACAIHCIALPFVVIYLPLLGLGFLAGEEAELAILGSAGLAALSSVWGFKHHRQWRACLLLLGSTTLVLCGFLLPVDGLEVFLHAMGGAGLAATHLTNKRLCSTCPGKC